MTMNFMLNNNIGIDVVDKTDNNTNMYWRDYRAIIDAYNGSTCDDICIFVVANNEDKIKHIDKIGTKVALNATNALVVSVITVDELHIFIKPLMKTLMVLICGEIMLVLIELLCVDT